MFFGMCIYETLAPDGRLDSIIITPAKDSILVADRLSDVGPRLRSDVDIGPLRFYTDECGLTVRTAAARLDAPAFEGTGSQIRFTIDHLHWPLRESHAGYYLLLLPPGFGGTIRSSDDYVSSVFMPDQHQILVSSMVYPDRASVTITGSLTKGGSQPADATIMDSTKLFRGSLPGVHYTPVDNLLKALRHDLAHSASAFLCHSSADKPEVRKLAIELAARGIRPWIDEAEIRTGDSLIGRIEEGIASSTCLVPVLSEASVSSRWCNEELRMALAKQITAGVKGVLPVLINDCDIPGFLLEKKYADLRNWEGYDSIVDALAEDIRVLDAV